MLDPISSLLQKLSSPQVEDLIFEQELLRNGYKLYYAIDNHDILKYCFPGDFEGDQFEMDTTTGRINYDLETDIGTAYDEFYSGLNRSNPLFFLNEYIPELKDMKHQMEQRIRRGQQLFNYARDFNAYFENLVTSSDNIIQDFTLFISIATGFIQQGTHRFNTLMTNPYFIFRNEQFPAIENGEVIRSAFKESYSKDKDLQQIEEIFDVFVSNSPKGNRFSKLTDSEAISRVIRLNNCLLKKGEKILVLFLSTSDLTKRVSRLITAQLPTVYLPGAELRKFNFHRTVEQLFVNRLLEDLDAQTRLERLQNCKEMIRNREELDATGATGVSTDLQKHVIENFKTLRERYVNTNLARKEQFVKIEKLSQELEQVKTNMNLGRLKRLYANLRQLSDQYASDNANLNDIKIVETSFKMGQTFMAAFNKAVAGLQSQHAIKVSRGKDKIAGAGQHLPIVFLHKEKSGANLLDGIAELYLDEFALLDNINSKKDQITREITKLASSIYDTEFDARSLEDKLILCLYLLVLPDANIANKTNNDFVEECLQELYDTGLYSPEDPIIYSDFLYILCWVLRRNAKYAEAMKIAEEGIKQYPDDPRFYHARFLVTACSISPDDKDRETKYLHCLRDINIAQEKYPAILGNKDHIIGMNILSTLLNSEIYTCSLMVEEGFYTGETKKEILQRIKEEKLPGLRRLVGKSYEDYPEFLHTEAYFEYLESETATDEATKKEKINSAITTLNKAIGLGMRLANYDTRSYNDLLLKLQTRLSAAPVQ